MTKVIYYTTTKGKNPTEEFLDSLQKQDKVKIFRILQYIEIYGLISALPHAKKITGTSLWEIRVLGKTGIRIMYATLYENSILLVHGFLKKKQKAPAKEVRIAINRMQDWLVRYRRP